ncbi:MAG: hypothetical protein KatS3mg038_1557 [Candidatus Kapaibacterium sp.]|nr:MAG: hypothetical protein KatS3mg038_1557 [Candidatus Kapabacteria bacterium]
MKLSDLYKEERELSVAIGDDALHVTYRPAAYTPLLEAMLQDSVAGGRPSQALAEALCALLVDWDLFNDDDEKLAINKSTLMSLPVGAAGCAFVRDWAGHCRKPYELRALRRWLETEGSYGEPPDWYRLIRAAKYLNVPPWELARQAKWWTEIALIAETAEAKAAERKTQQWRSR